MDFLIQRAKSKTYWLAIAVALLPYADAIVGVATGINPLAGTLISIGIAVMRELTSTPLENK